MCMCKTVLRYSDFDFIKAVENKRFQGFLENGGRTEGQMDGQTNRQIDRWMDRPTDGRTDPLIEMRGLI